MSEHALTQQVFQNRQDIRMSRNDFDSYLNQIEEQTIKKAAQYVASEKSGLVYSDESRPYESSIEDALLMHLEGL